MNQWNPWKLTAIGLVLVVATALITGVVVARWFGDRAPEVSGASSPSTSVATRSTPAPVATQPAPPRVVAQAGPPPESVVQDCNRKAAEESGVRDKTWDTAKDAGIGAVAGAAVGAATGAIAGGGKGAGKGAAIGGLVGAGGGTLYGLNENHKHDERYRAAYSACMHARGYTG
ncbi:MAG: hypothetical protein HY294_11045 [Candidatus Rokubacteria bacterium]|nr:hypothetical protein [Candidatus Rokubacteria bacterium]MBI3826522.1 hypothetical protein [Candidatus Rokubacteria bacterium]